VPYSISCNVAGSFDPGAAQPRRHHASKGRQLTSGRRLDAHRSRFVARARDLEPGLLSALRLDEVALSSADVLVRVCSLLTDGTDGRPWQERLEDAFQGGPKPEVVVARLEDLANGDLQSAIDYWARATRRAGYQAYARRLLGAADYDLLTRALREDAAVVALAVRRGVRGALPFVTAWEDALAVMSPEQLARATTVDVIGLNVGKLIHQLDSMLGEKVLPVLPMEVVDARAADFMDTTQLAAIVRENLSSSARHQLMRANEPLVRKLSGARDALKHSADGVSQAANSLIELIDRILRASSTRDEVLEWIDRELPGALDLVVEDRGPAGRRPTKMGEVLCFLYGGGRVAREPTETDDGQGPLFVHEVLAGVVVAARSELQRLKHADEPGDVDKAQLERLLAAVEGALLIGLWLQQLTARMNNQVEPTPT